MVNDSLGEEYQLVETTVEELSNVLTQSALCLHDGLMVPTDDGLAEKSEGTKKDNKLQSTESRGIDGIILPIVAEQLPSRVE